MRIIGILMILVGAGLMAWAFQVPVTVDGTGAMDGTYQPIANLDLMSQREMLLMLGGVIGICGWIATAAAYVADAMRPKPVKPIADGQF